MVGTGNYVDDIDAFVAREKDEAARDLRKALLTLLGVVLVTVLAAAGVATWMARSVTRPLTFLVDEASRLRAAVANGELAERGDAARVGAEFQPVVEGMNATLDAYAGPVGTAAACLERLARGDVPPPLTESYRGDFSLIQRSLNQCIEAVGAMVRDAGALAAAAVEGKLSARADATRHQGDFRRIVEGVNATLDAVMGPIDEAARVLEQLAARDLRARVTGSYRGDHARIKEAVNGTADALDDALAQVAAAASQVSSAAGEIASSSQAVAAGASEQASSLEETSASLETMASMTGRAAQSASQAQTLAGAASAAATEGSAAMDQMVGAMARIRESAQGTAQIIKDINEISFQTNLLALNAAVEAARAGEAGRGFAVVAEEVRGLAQRAKEASRKTDELIRRSVQEAAAGEALAGRVTARLADIVGGVSKVAGIVAELAQVSREQAAGIGQVTTAVAQMNEVTQRNAASAEESSSASSELAGQAQQLAAVVGSFRLDGALERA